MTNVERIFEEIAQRVSEAAADVKCSPAEYRDGLLTIMHTLQDDHRASEESDPEAFDPGELG